MMMVVVVVIVMTTAINNTEAGFIYPAACLDVFLNPELFFCPSCLPHGSISTAS